MLLRTSIAILAIAFSLPGCDSDEDEGGVATPADGGARGGDGGASSEPTGATSDCEVAYSCSAYMAEGIFSCVEVSTRPEGAKEACEQQSIDSLTYVYSETPCPRNDPSAGCLVGNEGTCQVSWIYGPGAESSASLCASQGHQPVVR